jgi:nitrogenase molybdenum-iron protein beta chain
MSSFIEQPRYVCALGAQQSVLGIKRAIPIIHAGPGCSSKMFEALGYDSGFQGGGYAGGCAVPSTNSSEKEVVFGGEAKLRSTIEGAVKVMDGDLFVVLTGCTADIVGDDVAQIVAEYRENGIPIVNAETGGFKGNNYYGHELVLQAIIEQWIGNTSPQIKKGLVNVFSVLPYQNTFWRADLEEIKALLGKIGLQANILFGPGSAGVAEWKNIPRAQFNLLISPWAGFNTVNLLKDKYGTPFLHYPVLPAGAIETSKFLRTVGAFAGVDPLEIENVVSAEEDSYYEYFVGAADFFTELRWPLPHKFYSIADSAYALGFGNYLINELGLIPSAQYVIENPPENYQNGLKAAFSNLSAETAANLVIENDGGKIHRLIKDEIHKAGETLILGSSWERDLAREIQGYLLNVSIPVNHRLVLNKTYLGYKGGLNLMEDIYAKVLESGT